MSNVTERMQYSVDLLLPSNGHSGVQVLRTAIEGLVTLLEAMPYEVFMSKRVIKLCRAQQ